MSSTSNTTETTQASVPIERLRSSILQTVAYAHIFRFPLTVSELSARLIGTVASEERIAALLDSDGILRRELEQHRGFVFRHGYTHFVEHRSWARLLHDELISENRTGLRWLARIPGLRLIAFSGGTAHRNSIEEADLDLFLVTERGKLYGVYGAIILLSRILGKRGLYCANFFVDEDHLEFDNHDLYTASELVHLRALEESATIRRLWEGNEWIRGFYPNARPHPVERLWTVSRGELRWRRTLELWLHPFARLAEPMFRRFFQKRLRKKLSSSAGSGVALENGRLQLHFSDRRSLTLERFEEELHPPNAPGPTD